MAKLNQLNHNRIAQPELKSKPAASTADLTKQLTKTFIIILALIDQLVKKLGGII